MVPFAVLNLHVEVPTAIVPPEGFETKMKHVLPQAGAIRQKKTTVERPTQTAFLVLPEVHIWRMAAPHWGHYTAFKRKTVLVLRANMVQLSLRLLSRQGAEHCHKPKTSD